MDKYKYKAEDKELMKEKILKTIDHLLALGASVDEIMIICKEAMQEVLEECEWK